MQNESAFSENGVSNDVLNRLQLFGAGGIAHGREVYF